MGKLFVRTILGTALFALGFRLFLLPNELNAGGISGLSMLLVQLTGVGSVGVYTMVLNLPLFVLAGFKLGKRFLVGSFVGTVTASVLIDLFALLPFPKTEPLIGCLYGGILCGLGLGTVFAAGSSTGGSDIIVRLLKHRYKAVPLGKITMGFDLAVAVITGLVFNNFEKTLYSAVAIILLGRVIDAVVYRFDYSRVVLIISRHHQAIAERISSRLGRGATFLYAKGSFSGQELNVVLTAIRRQQLSELKELVTETDPDAFVIVQEAHQVLGDGFLHPGREMV